MSEEKFVDVSRAALILGVSPTTVRNMIKAQILPTMLIGVGSERRHRRIPRAALATVNPTREEGFEEAVAREGGRLDIDGLPIPFHVEATQSTQHTQHTERTERTESMERRPGPGTLGQPSTPARGGSRSK